MANSSIILSNLDFDTLKNTFKSYLRSQDKFNDYDFDGSNMSVLLDILAYNSFHNAFYLNMIGNEMFLDSSQLKDSVVSHAKELNYTPRSFKSASAKVNIVVRTYDLTKKTLVIDKGTTFTSNQFNKNYTFSTEENVVLSDFTDDSGVRSFYGNGITLHEGYYVSDTYTYTYDSTQRLIITNSTVDISSLNVTVIEDGGASVITYNRSQSLFDIDSTSPVFFVQGAENDSYEVVFGDGVSGRRPKNNSVIVLEYRICNGQLPNGCNEFMIDVAVDGETNVTINTVSSAAGGSVSESAESIKYNAPRHFAAQERAVTTEDYESLLKINFPEINAVTAYGGEDLDPPQFGRVFIAVDLLEVDGLPDNKKTQYYKFLKPRSPVSIDPVFVNPEYTYIGVTSKIKYNVNVTRLTPDDVKTIVTSSIVQYSLNNLNNFNRVFRYSKLVQTIDNSQLSIVSNETDVNVIKMFNPKLGQVDTFDVDFKLPLTIQYVNSLNYSINSTQFVYKGVRSFFRDDGIGNIQVVSADNNAPIETVGLINYESGLLQFSNVKIDSIIGSRIKFYAKPKNKDISTINNVILNIVEDDLSIEVEGISV